MLLILLIIIILLLKKNINENFNKDYQMLLFGSSNGLGKVMKEELEKKYKITTVGKSNKNNIIFDFKKNLSLLFNQLNNNYDLIIINYYDDSHSIFINLEQTIKLVNFLIKKLNKNGKLIYVSSGIVNNYDSEFINYNVIKTAMEKFIKLKSLIIKDKNLIIYQINDSYNTPLTRKFLPNYQLKNPKEIIPSLNYVINYGTNGFIYQSNNLSNYELNYQGISLDKLDNIDNNENKAIKSTKYYNNNELLIKTLSKKYNLPKNKINLHFGTLDFIKDVINLFVPKNHHILSFDLTWDFLNSFQYPYINIDKTIINNYYQPNYNDALNNITSLTRLIYLVAPLYRKELENFIKKINKNIIILLDFCYFDYLKDNKLFFNYQDGLKYHNIIIINTFSKIYGRPDLRLAFSISNLSIIKNLTFYNIPLNIMNQAIKLLNDNNIINKTRNYYNDKIKKLNKNIILINPTLYYYNNKYHIII